MPKTPRFWSLILCKGAELGHIVLLNANSKSYLGSPIWPFDLTFNSRRSVCLHIFTDNILVWMSHKMILGGRGFRLPQVSFLWLMLFFVATRVNIFFSFKAEQDFFPATTVARILLPCLALDTKWLIPLLVLNMKTAICQVWRRNLPVPKIGQCLDGTTLGLLYVGKLYWFLINTFRPWAMFCTASHFSEFSTQ